MKISDMMALGLIALGGCVGVLTMNAWPLIGCLLAACAVLVVFTPEWRKARQTLAEAAEETTLPIRSLFGTGLHEQMERYIEMDAQPDGGASGDEKFPRNL